MALLAARRAAALVRPTSAAALLRPTAAGARFSSAPDYSAFVRGLRDISDSLRAEKEHSSRPSAAELRAKSDSLRAATHDCEIVGVLNSVIQSHHRDLVDGIPSDFPFEISKEEGLSDITLTRSLKGEQIEVVVSMLKPGGDEEESSDSGYTSDEDEGDNSMPLTVTVSKADGSSLKFACTAYPDTDNIFIDTLSVRQPQSGAKEQEDAVSSKDDPDFSDLDVSLQEARSELDDRLQEALRKYLVLRGVTPMNIKLLHQYLISKDILCNQLWLTKLRDFVKKD